MTLRKVTKQVVLQFLFVFLLVEAALRLFPTAISPAWLVHFNSNIRSEISERLGLKIKATDLMLQRSDGGRPFYLLPPKQKVFVPVGTAVPISFFIFSAVESPINRLNFFLIKLIIC